MPRRYLTARSGRPPLAGLLGLVPTTCAVLLVPAFAVAFAGNGDDGALCRAPQGLAWTVALVGRPPPPGAQAGSRLQGRDCSGRRWHHRGSDAAPGTWPSLPSRHQSRSFKKGDSS